MHSTTSSARLGCRGWALAALFAALLLLTLVQAAPALAAATYFDGGPLTADTPTNVANDHTVYAMRFNATTGDSNTLAADTTYHVKLRFTPNSDGSPAGVDNRGFTWNGTTSTWVQEREDWSLFPTVTTDSTGAIPQSDWFYCKFGDATKSGVYYLMVSLSPRTSGNTTGNTRNSTGFVAVTVLNMESTGAWVHEGVDNSAQAEKRADIVETLDESPSPSPSPCAVQFDEANTCDDDDNGVVDDEQYGPVKAGGFRMGVPVDRALYVRLQKKVWSVLPTGFTLTTPDTDIALGAADQTAPTAPTSPGATAQDAGATITWTAATDATGVTGYKVYRWSDATGTTYTPMPAKVGTVTGTSFTDTGLTNGTTYHYLVRAFDAATNVGPRSTTVDATPQAPTSLTLAASPKTVNWGKPWTLSGALVSGGAAIPDATAKLMQSLDGGTTWTLVNTLTPTAGTSTYAGSIAAPPQKSVYKLAFDGDAAHTASESTTVTVTPRVKLGRPVAPTKVKKGKKLTVYGSLVPKQKAGSKTVRIKCYQKKGGAWKLRKTVTATNRNYKTYSRYSATLALTAKGSWKLVATSAATAKFAATTSSARIVKVR